MVPKSVAVVSLIIGFVSFLTINRVISSSNLNLPDLKAIVLSQIPAGQNPGFSKLLSQKNGVTEKSTPQVVENPVTTQIPKPAGGTSGNKIEITEAQINQSINSFIPAGTPLHNLVIKLEEGSIKVTGRLLSPISGDLAAQATVTSVDYKIVIKIQNATVGAMTIPAFLLTSLEGAANQVINSFAQQEDGTTSIKSIEVHEGKILITT